MPSAFGVVATAVALGGCGIGVGSMSATTRPLLGRKVVNDHEWDDGCVSREISRDYFLNIRRIRTMCGEPNEYSGATKATRWFGLGGGWKRGTATATLQGKDLGSTSINEIDATALVHLPVKWFGLSLGATYVTVLEGDAVARGGGFRGSVAPIPQLSLDAAYTWIGGDHSDKVANTVDFSGRRASIGGTVMLYGLQSTRLALSVAYTTTDAGPYQSHGYTYQFVYTLW